MESGGYENLLNSQSDQIDKLDVKIFIAELVMALNKIDATAHAKIIESYGESLVNMFLDLKNGWIDEESFYNLIEAVDSADEQSGEQFELIEVK